MPRFIYAAMAAVLFVLPQTSHAQDVFGDCTSPVYRAEFSLPVAPPDEPQYLPDERILDLECIEFFRLAIGNGSFIRGLTDPRADWAVEGPVLGNVEAGSDMALQTMRRMPATGVGNITILVLDGPEAFADPDRGTPDRTGTGAATYGTRTPPQDVDGDGDADTTTPDTELPPECMVSFFTLRARNEDPIWVQNATAHEIMHCIQAYVVPAQYATGRGGQWWVEGTAEHFAALSVPSSQPYNSRNESFALGVRARRPLYEASYGGGLFFHWWGASNDASDLIPFMRSMATSADAGAQRNAMRRALGDEQWLQFARDYIDGNISHPQGGLIPTTPFPEGPIAVHRNWEKPFNFVPFAIEHYTFDFDCGLWDVELRPSDVNIAVRRQGEDWMDLPAELDIREGREGFYDFVVFNTGDSTQNVTIEFERTATCTPCNDREAIDACLAGTWEMTGGGPVEWMESQGLPISNVNEGPRIVQFFSDGLYRAGAVDLFLRMDLENDDWGEGDGASFEAIGNWSADKETEDMAFCQMAGGAQGEVTVSHDGDVYTVPVAQGGAAQIEMSYKCNVDAGQLTTQMDVPGFSAMTTTYTRIAEEPKGGAGP